MDKGTCQEDWQSEGLGWWAWKKKMSLYQLSTASPWASVAHVTDSP